VSGRNETGGTTRDLGGYGLTVQERKFVGIYVGNGYNATGAYETMHPRCKKSTAHIEGLRIRKRLRVDAAIRDLAGREMKKIDVTAERTMQEIACIAFLDPCDYINDDGSMKLIHEIPEEARRAISGLDISEIWEGPRGEREVVGHMKKIGITSKTKALELLVRIQGMITEKHEHGVTDDLAAMLAKARKRKRTTVEEVTMEDLFE